MNPLRQLHGRRTAVVLTALAVVGLPTAAVAADTHPDRTRIAKQAIQGGKARNVILLIGDGMGDSEITIARNYQVGAAGRLAMDKLPLTGAYTTYSVQKGNPAMPDYTPDSAATATAWATGHKSYDGAISVTPDERPQPTILELARAAGFRTGNVSTAELQDATPASLGAHVVDRDCKGPQSMRDCPSNAKENGGAGSIAEQQIETKPDVLLGGGKQYFDQTVQAGRYQGLTVLQQAQVNDYRIVTDAAGLAAVAPGAPVLGVFATSTMDVEWVGPTPTRNNTPPTPCAPNAARAASQPHLVDMAAKAIELLDAQTQDARKGFFLQIEGASIDKQDHAANAREPIRHAVQPIRVPVSCSSGSVAVALTQAESAPVR
jgi:alkaline phosphatase